MPKITNMDDCKQAVITLTVNVGHLSEGLQKLEKIVAEHIKGHGSTWVWIVPTVLLLIQIIVTSILLAR